MRTKLVAAAILGLTAGCAETIAPAPVPRAPDVDPEGAVMRAPVASASAPAPKMSCGAKGSCNAKKP